MDAKQILADNFEEKNNSFLYFLHEKSSFNKEAFKELYECIRAVAEGGVCVGREAQQIAHIYGQIMKCILYHFDKNDQYEIADFPENYNKIIEYLEKSVEYYFRTRI